MTGNKKLAVGILAHVDAGKTTLAEGILYSSGAIRKLGRVDHKDAFLDTDEMEKNRGITIFSKQAQIELGDWKIALLDTPGHVDFSAEMERTLQVLDYAILVISGADGVQSHVETLWRLLKRYRIPTFLFINKMDQPGTDPEKLMEELQKRLDERCIWFGRQEQGIFYEEAAVCDEALLEEYLETGSIREEQIGRVIAARHMFPCFFGSALKMTGVEEFLKDFSRYVLEPEYPENFGARVFKISRDRQGNRLTHLKITGGSLKVKELLEGTRRDSAERWEEKVDQIRIYSGVQYETANEVKAGTICAVTGLESTYAGEGLGAEQQEVLPVLEPVLTFSIGLPEGVDVHSMYMKLRQLEEEEPQLHLVWNEQYNEIHAQIMGEVQVEILKHMIWERFQVEVEFGSGSIVYKETIKEPVEGVGHYEPLRHYAEVHLILEPLEPGSGLQFDTVCSEDELEGHWQRLILSHLTEKKHPGVLTGSEITDMKITLAAGKSHIKHTEGGDFRQSTYRAVRQGLKMAECVLLEPIYEFVIEVPQDMIGRAMSDVQKMQGSFEPPETDGETAVLRGTAPVATMRGYQQELLAYAKGRGRLSCALKGYEPCHNAEEVIERLAYDPEADLQNPTGSVFCSHGAGFNVSWDKVYEYMHLPACLMKEAGQEAEEPERYQPPRTRVNPVSSGSWEEERELEEIFTKTFGPARTGKYMFDRNVGSLNQGKPASDNSVPGKYGSYDAKKTRECLLVDGYNVIYAWEELTELAKISFDGARGRLLDILSNYQGYKNNIVIVVFDAYKMPGYPGEVQRYHNIYVVYTKEAETADQYIEKVVDEIDREFQVTVATSDFVEQLIIFGKGAHRISSRELREEVENVNREIRENYVEKHKKSRNYLGDHMPEGQEFPKEKNMKIK